MDDLPPLRARRFDPDMVVAGCAILISLFALVVSVMEVRIMREQQRMAVWPRLVASVSSEAGFTVKVRNHGIGPALIESVVVTVDGRPQRRWGPAVRALVGLPEGGFDYARSYTHSTVNGQVLLPGASIDALTIAPGAGADSAAAHGARLGVRVCYCSVYGECWRVTDEHVGGSEGSTQRVMPAPRCAEPAADRFEM
jgi:hypothetical protein